jgi:hypothetical protein
MFVAQELHYCMANLALEPSMRNGWSIAKIK